MAEAQVACRPQVGSEAVAGGRRAGQAGLEHSTGTLVGERGQACSQKQGQTGLLIRGSQTETKLGTGSEPRAPFHNPPGKALRSEPSSGPRGHQRGGKSFLFPETPQGWHWELAPSPAWCPLSTEGGWGVLLHWAACHPTRQRDPSVDRVRTGPSRVLGGMRGQGNTYPWVLPPS